jgi:hypothetical protein
VAIVYLQEFHDGIGCPRGLGRDMHGFDGSHHCRHRHGPHVFRHLPRRVPLSCCEAKAAHRARGQDVQRTRRITLTMALRMPLYTSRSLAKDSCPTAQLGSSLPAPCNVLWDEPGRFG